MTTPNTFTIEGQTFTVGDKWLYGGSEVEIVGQVGGKVQARFSVAFRHANGNIDSSIPKWLKPIPEPTIEVPLSVAKVLALGHPETVSEVPAAMQTMADLLKEAGY